MISIVGVPCDTCQSTSKNVVVSQKAIFFACATFHE